MTDEVTVGATDEHSLRWEFDQEMGNYHLRLGKQYIGHFYSDQEARGIDIQELLTRIAPLSR